MRCSPAAPAVSLTARGHELFARVSSAVDAAGAAASDSLPGDRASGTVLLGGPAEWLSQVLLPGLIPALADGPALRVTLGQASELLEDLRTGGLDLVVSSIQPRLRGLEVVPLFDEEFVLVAQPCWADQLVANPDAVPVLAYAAELPIIRRYWRSVFERRPSGLRVVATVPDLRVLAELAAQGVGATVLPTYLAAPYLADGRLVDPIRPPVPPLNTVYLARRRTSTEATPAVDEVARAIVRVAGR